ncbi:Ubiquitin carboxyl-terminal hydrolase, partial [Globisporangium splendens]
MAQLQEFASRVRVAKASDRVYRDECVFSFDSPLSPEGIYTNLRSLQSFGAAFVPLDLARAAEAQLYLHQTHRKVKKADAQEGGEQGEAAPTKLAIGGEDGFAANPEEDKYDVVKTHALVAFSPADPTKELLRVPADSPDVPKPIRDAIQALLNHAGNTVVEEVTSWQEELKETKYAEHLIQVPDAPKISSNPSAWKCQAAECDKQENLWLNLSDGFIGCGRKNWDGTGGCGSALDHYKATGEMYPLAVKLGTITAEGGDVYSYAADEDDMVTNKYLKQHLQHFGININNMKKTDKSMNELQVGLNMNYEFDKITESGKKLQPVSGAGYIGFKNLGNSCYMNSVLQLFLTLPEVKKRYFDAAQVIFSTSKDYHADDFAVQMAKLAHAVLSDRYSRPVSGDDDEEAQVHSIDLRPSTFRGLVGKGHPDFSTGQQQDAVEYFQHLLDFLTRQERVAAGRIGRLFDGEDTAAAELPTASLFKFAFEDRVECLASHKVKYVPRDDFFVQLHIPVEAATNANQVKEYQVLEQKRQRIDDGESKAKDSDGKNDAGEKVVPVVPFHACLDKTFAQEVIEDFLSSATGKKGLAQKTVRFKSFPRYLLVQMRRFYVSEDWTPEKLDVVVDVPEELSLSRFLSPGLVEGEELLPETATDSGAAQGSSASSVVTPDDSLVAQLVSMGFSENGCKRAAIATGNADPETAMEWIFSHMEDPDFNDPPVLEQGSSAASSNESFNMEHVSMLSAMGFSEDQAKCALSQTDHNPDRAAEWLFSHMDDLDAAVAKAQSENAATASAAGGEAAKRLDNDAGEYSLVGFVSHIGKNTSSGHYVCHLKKDGRWIIFNDDKVALSEDPPLGSGYLYLFRRKDVKA